MLSGCCRLVVDVVVLMMLCVTAIAQSGRLVAGADTCCKSRRSAGCDSSEPPESGVAENEGAVRPRVRWCGDRRRGLVVVAAGSAAADALGSRGLCRA